MSLAEDLSDEMRMGQDPLAAPADTVYFDGVPYPVLSINYSDLGRFEPKVTIGDYSKESDQLLSSWIQSSWSGGALVDEHIEGATDSRFRFSTLWTRSPGQLTLGPGFHQAVSGGDIDGATDIRLVGDYKGNFYASADGKLVKILMDPSLSPDYPERANETIGTLPGPPVNRGVYFKSQLWIPCGAAGLATTNGTTVTTDATKQAVSLVLWDTRMFALLLDGSVIIHDGTSWGATKPERTLPGDRVPRHLVWFYDRTGEPTVFVVTDRDIWAWEPSADVLHPGRLRVPPHRDNGLAVCEWRDDALYYTAGLQVYRYSGSGTISAVGLDRDDGLPTKMQHHRSNQQVSFVGGRIIDMVAEHNMIVAHVQGASTPTDPAPEAEAEWEAGPFEGSMDVAIAPPQAWSALMVWNEAGWHCLRLSNAPTTVQPPTHPSLALSTAGGEYCLFVVEDAVLYQTFLAREFFGPRQLVQRNTGTTSVDDRTLWFAPNGVHETGRFDAGMAGFRKLADRLEINVWHPNDGFGWDGPSPGVGTPTTIEVRYRTDRAPTFWRKLGDVTDYGTTVLPFGVDDDGFARGEAFTWIEFRYVVTAGFENYHRPPVIDSTVFKFIKLPLEGRSWVMTIDLDRDNWMGLGPTELRDHLTALTTAEKFSTMVHGQTSYRVRVSQAQGAEGTGYDNRKAVTLTVLHVPQQGGA